MENQKGKPTDEQIVELLFARDEDGLVACKTLYGAYIFSILQNILRNREDSEECFNDTLLALWNTVPPARPASLKGYLGTLARNIGINLYTKKNRQKRSTQTVELLEELVSVDSGDDPEGQLLAKALSAHINEFLEGLDKGTRICFVLRYYYAATIDEIAEKTGKNKHAVTALLSKTRNRLRDYLIRTGDLS